MGRKQKPIRDRILEFRRVPARQLRAHPMNWRQHPPTQTAALRAALAEIGWAGALLARRDEHGDLVLLDGHLRAELDPDAEVPVLVLDLSEAEGQKLLATYDPLTGLAETDADALGRLLHGIEPLAGDFGALLDTLTPAAGFDLEPPDSVTRNMQTLEKLPDRKTMNAQTVARQDTERYIVLVYPSRAAREAVLRQLGLPVDERYLPAQAYELRARARSGRQKFIAAGKAAPVRKAGGQG